MNHRLSPSIRILAAPCILALAALACNLPFGAATPAPPTETPPQPATADLYTEPPPLFPTDTPSAPATPTATAAPTDGPRVSFGGVSFEVVPGVLSSAAGTIDPLQEGEAGMTGWPGPAPEDIRFELQGYPLAQPWIKPQILVFPIQEYAAVNAPAGEIAARLDNLLRAVQAGVDHLPFLPMWNAGQVFYARPQILSFRSGQGIRYLTCYAQALVRIDAGCLFYTFQGLTSDGKYYVSAILPVDLPDLHTGAADQKWNAVMADNTLYASYLGEVSQLLASASPQAFLPDLNNLDALVSSLIVSPTVTLKTPAVRAFSCPGAQASRLAPASRARVTFTDGTPLRVREDAGKSAKILKTIPEGTEMYIIEGPKCADRGVWWRMQTKDGAIGGWVMEGEDGVYFIEPWP